MGMTRTSTRKWIVLAATVGVVGALVPAGPAMAARVQSAPPPRIAPAMSNDAAGHVVMFGGLRREPTNDTWIWDGSSWTRYEGIRPARRTAAMAYDAATGQVVMFGRPVGHKPSSPTWTWDGTSWTEQHPAHTPSLRQDMAMAYDAATGQVVMFGGQGQTELDDTWAWNGTDWTRLHPVHSPSPRHSLGMAYDAAAGTLVLFGGRFANQFYDDTWTWDGTDWTQVSTPRAPSPRSDFAMAYDAADGRIVLFGGDVFGETWTWNGSGWKLLHPAHSPALRFTNGMAYDPAAGQVVMYGGEGFDFFGDTWTWDGSDWTIHLAGSLSVFPKSGGPNNVIFTLWGFEPGERVRITFVDSVKGNTLMARVRTDAGGGLTTDPIPIPEGGTPGRQSITAKGARSGQVAKVGYTLH
jgi:hypothetical protein